MTERRLSAALVRHPRPQEPSFPIAQHKVPRTKLPRVPTKAALLAREPVESRARVHRVSPSWVAQNHVSQVVASSLTDRSHGITAKAEPNAFWHQYTRLGNIVQGRQKVIVAAQCPDHEKLCMFREKRLVEASISIEDLRDFKHPNILIILEAFKHEQSFYIKFEYSRYTLEEVIQTRLCLTELHVHVVAEEIFQAICYLASQRLIHGCVSPENIRFANHTPRLLLGGWEHSSTVIAADQIPNTDLEDLGLVLLQCMDGRLRSHKNTTVQDVKDKRALNKVYGLETAEKWSAHKQLIDLLDDLFGTDREASKKMEQPHPYLMQETRSAAIFAPYFELVSLESFTLWQVEEPDPELA